MNNNLYNNTNFPGTPIFNNGIPTPNQTIVPTQSGEFEVEQSYIENILRLNKGKRVTIHNTYPDSNEWRDRIFKGIIEQSGRDHIILSDPNTGKWYLILMIYVDFIEFDEKINYSQEFIPNNWY